ncbi:MAG: hypothetical protein FWE32_10900 [Oscillospiraceae bacterium]|nr:hypothetical protein [Oscillospiraceae bacterium]
MSKQNYLAWMAENTATQWTNDSAILSQLEHAIENGAVGTTTNPPLSYEGLTVDAHLYEKDLAALRRDCSDDEFAEEAMGLVVKNLSRKLMPMHEARGGHFGCVRAQLQPGLHDDAGAMLAMGKRFAAWGKNVMVKVPGTQAGIWVMEELAALGIPTNPTVLCSVSQIVASAEAYERGYDRALKAGITPAWTTEALVMGRLQDYLSNLNTERNAGVAVSDLAWAAIEMVKRTYHIFQKKGYKTIMQGAAFRCAMHVEQMVGGPFCSTIHPSIQTLVRDADALGEMRRQSCIEEPVDPAIIDRVAKAFPEVWKALEPDALAPDEFADFGPVKMTLENFDTNGWQKLISLKGG